VQLGGALKNVYAIGCGLAIGMALGESARAALMTRSFAEMVALAQAYGAASHTLMGLSGLGDLALTCGSTQSRNFAHGLALGAGDRPAQATVEGIATAAVVTELAQARGVVVPIASGIADLLAKRLTASEVVEKLMSRPLKTE